MSFCVKIGFLNVGMKRTVMQRCLNTCSTKNLGVKSGAFQFNSFKMQKHDKQR